MDVCIFISNSQNRQERMTIKRMEATKHELAQWILLYCIIVSWFVFGVCWPQDGRMDVVGWLDCIIGVGG